MPRTKSMGKPVAKSFQLTEAQDRALTLVAGGARNVLLYGGSRSGKTFFLLLCIVIRALRAPGSRHCIFRHHFNAVKRTVWFDTLPAVFRTCFPNMPYKDNRSDWYITLPNGSEIWIGGLDDKERVEKVLGSEYSTLFYNECSEMSYSSVTTALTRLAQKVDGISNRAFFDCNPPSTQHWSHRLFMERVDPLSENPLADPGQYVTGKLNPLDNAANIADGYIEGVLKALPERQRRRFLDGEWLEDVLGALWTREMIEASRMTRGHPSNLVRVVIAVDPAVTKTEFSAETGIIAAGKDAEGVLYVLEDGSLKGTPLEWGQETVSLYERFQADRVVGEVNNGGDLVESNLRHVAPALPYRAVRATRGKMIRAEPIAGLYEQGKVKHVGFFPELEDQLCSYTGKQGEESPDRLDALVWALTELTDKPKGTVGIW